MLYAFDSDGNRVEPTPNATGMCTLCNLPLLAKCGVLNEWHWSHRAGDCDPWTEPETEWHRSWKRRAPKSWCEVPLPPHRADVQRPDGLVIELQYSHISAPEIAEREAFYGNMWWLFHRDRFGKRAGFFAAENGLVRLGWKNGSRTLPLISKPLFCDLGGPVVEFTSPLGRLGGVGRLLSRQQFLQRAGLRALDETELLKTSHTEVRWSKRASDDVIGVVAPSAKHLEDLRERTRIRPLQLKEIRHDGSETVIWTRE